MRAVFRPSTIALVAIITLALLAAGCSSADIVYVADGTSYDGDSVTEAASAEDAPDVIGQPTEDAPDLRHDVLVSLRGMGSDPAQAADLLTEQFPGDSRAVPYHVEAATYEGTDAWVVFEAYGAAGGTLDRQRVWVFDREDGRILFVASVN